MSLELIVMRVHVLLAIFFFPMALVFLVSGGLSLMNIEGEGASVTYDVAIDKPLEPDLDALMAVARVELEARDIPMPTLRHRVNTRKDPFRLELRGLKHFITLRNSKSETGVARLKVFERNWLARLWYIHEGKAGPVFKGLAVTWASTYIVILITGLFLGFKLRRLRYWALGSLSAGVIATITLVATH